MKRKLLSHISQCVALISLVLAAISLQAQTTTLGAIAGTVTDPTGAVVPNAQIKVTNQGTHKISITTTSSQGYYTVENLPDGDYTISCSIAGFKQVDLTDFHLDPGQRRGQDIKVAVGNVDTKVEVRAESVAVQTESAES